MWWFPIYYYQLLCALLLAAAVLVLGRDGAQIESAPAGVRGVRENRIAAKTALIFSETGGFRHSIIDTAFTALASEMTRRGGWLLTRTDVSTGFFTPTVLASFDVVVFFFTSGDGSNGPLQVAGEKAAFESFIKNGGGYVGIHSATDTYQTSWPFYKLLVGAAFVNHPAVQIATMRFESHQTTQGIPSPWVLSDEWYNFDYAFPEFRQTVQVLATVDESTYTGGTNGADHPIAWSHIFAGGRSWYSGLGHTDEVWAKADYRKFVGNGLEWAATARPTPCAPIPMFAVNAGSATSAFTASDGQIYSIDTFFTGGRTYSTIAPITGTTDAVLYQTERYGALRYAFPVTIGSEYLITIKMSEIYFSEVGKRVFGIQVEGVQIATAVDLVALVGKNTAYDVVHTYTAADSVLNIDFVRVLQNPKVGAILVELLPSCRANKPSVVPTFSPTVKPSRVPVTASPTVAPVECAITAFAINAGSATSPFKAASGQIFQVDEYFSAANTYSTASSIAGTLDDTLYQTERWTTGGALSYAFPVKVGIRYRVTIKMAEIYFSAAGQRVFDIKVEGVQIATNVDLFALVGKNAAYDVVHTVIATEDRLNIDLIRKVWNPKVNAILVEELC